jgi:ribosomal protein S18 acetylase RimI-like enzyme
MELLGIEGLFKPGPRDAEPIAAMIASALEQDPLNRYFFGGSLASRGGGLTLFRLIAGYGIRQGSLLATSPRLEGAAYWQLPKDRPTPPRSSAGRSAALPDRQSGGPGWYAGAPAALALGFHLLARAGLRGVRRMVHSSSFSLALRRRHAPFAHGYLALLAVDPRHQGRGLAGTLLRPVLARLEEHGLPCYLETHLPRNVSFYRHFGFEVLEEVEIPGTGVRQWCLLKKK